MLDRTGLHRTRTGRIVAGLRLSVGLGLFGWAQLASAAATCPPAGFSKQRLSELKAAQFSTLPLAQREPLALSLLECLDNPDPVLRDDIAFESLTTLMRSQQISTAAATTILQRLQPQLAVERSDPTGFIKPFAALTLAEIARMDRIEPFLSPPQWSSLVQAATSYLSSVRDYRGFDANEGWRHGVAHGADLLLQLSLNPRATKADLDAALAAIATQIVPAAGHYYIYGEPLRLARPTFYVAQRTLHTEQEWSAWLQSVTQPAPLSAWNDAFKSQGGLAKRHNTVNFLAALYVLLQENGSTAARERLLVPLQAALAAVP